MDVLQEKENAAAHTSRAPEAPAKQAAKPTTLLSAAAAQSLFKSAAGTSTERREKPPSERPTSTRHTAMQQRVHRTHSLNPPGRGERERRATYQGRSIPESILLQVEENLARGRRLAEEACSRYAAAAGSSTAYATSAESANAVAGTSAAAIAAALQGSKAEAAKREEEQSNQAERTADAYSSQHSQRINQLRRSVSEQLQGSFQQWPSAAESGKGAAEYRAQAQSDELRRQGSVPGNVAAGEAVQTSPGSPAVLRGVSTYSPKPQESPGDAHPGAFLDQFGVAQRKDSFTPDANGGAADSLVTEAWRKQQHFQKRLARKSVNEWLDEMVEAATVAAGANKEKGADGDEADAELPSPLAREPRDSPLKQMQDDMQQQIQRAARVRHAAMNGAERRKARYNDWMDEIVEAAMQSAKAAEAKVKADIMNGMGKSDDLASPAPATAGGDVPDPPSPPTPAEEPLDDAPSPFAGRKEVPAAWTSPERAHAANPLLREPRPAPAAAPAEPAPPAETPADPGPTAQPDDQERPCPLCGTRRAPGTDADGNHMDTRLVNLEEEYNVQQMLLRTALNRQAQMESEMEQSKARVHEDEQELDSLRKRNTQLQTELKRTQQLCQEMASGRRSARAALAEMASHNARLVAAFAEKKQEVRRLSSEVERQSSISEASIEELEAALQAAHVEAATLRTQLSKLASKGPDSAGLAPVPELSTSGEGGGKEEQEKAERAVAAAAAKQAQWDVEREQMKKEMEYLRKSLAMEKEKVSLLQLKDNLGHVTAKMDKMGQFKNGRDRAHSTAAAAAPREAPREASRPPAARPAPAAPQPAPSAAPKQPDRAPASKAAPPADMVSKMQEENAKLQADNARLREQERQNALRRKVEQHKADGNNAFHQGKYQQAAEEYSEGINAGLQDDKINAILICNRSACLQGLAKYLDAIMDCCKAAKLDSSYVRAYQRRADAYIAIGDYNAACKDLDMLQGMGCSDIGAKLADCRQKSKRSSQVDHYAVLGIASSATSGEIKTAYRQLALKHHPDKVTSEDMRDAAEAIFKYIQSAYAVLSDATARRKYDCSLQSLRYRYGRSFSFS